MHIRIILEFFEKYKCEVFVLLLFWFCFLFWLFFDSEVKVAQSCPALCYSMDYIVHGILQARILVSVAFSSYRGSSQPRDQTQVSRIAGGFFTV